MRISNAFKTSRTLVRELKSKYNIVDFVIHFILAEKKEIFICCKKKMSSGLSCFVYSYLVSKYPFAKSK